MYRICLALVTLLAPQALSQPPSREQRVRDDRKKVESEGFWIYNDLARGITEARNSGKPLLVVLRCVPCEECVRLDDELLKQDPAVRPLLDKFVCVPVVSTNGIDLALFQFDTDQSFAVFLLNADGTIYGRFGTRSHRTDWAGDVSLPGLAKALAGALALHTEYPKNGRALADKRGPKPEVVVPEKLPTLAGRFGPTLDYGGNVVRSCIHCHQIGDAVRDGYRSRKQPMPESVLFPHPHPKSIGLILDPKECATVLRVEAESAADKAGFRAGDSIQTLNGQPLLSIADVQWVLDRTAAEGGTIEAEVDRNGSRTKLSLRLADGWRRAGDLSWRSSSWGLRRMATGGLLLEAATPTQREAAGVAANEMALRVKHVGQYGPHAAAKQAGVRKDDVIVAFDGRTDLRRETDVLAHGVTAHAVGERVPVTIARDGKRLTLMLPMQP